MGKKRWSVFSPNHQSNHEGVLLPLEKEKTTEESNAAAADVATFLGGGEAEDWRRFKEAGFLDESEFRRKDRAALVERIERLEKELHDYQYNMGLLLIEKEKWTSEHTNIREALGDAESMLKREQTARLIDVTELEKQEENLRKALEHEKQCVKDLEKALEEMSAELAVAKLTSDRKLAEDHALQAIIEDKYLEVRGNLHSADAKLAEASRRSTEIDIKLQEVETRERRLQKECSNFLEEKREHEEYLSRQREDLQSWEKRLLESEERLVESQFLSREERNSNIEGSDVNKKEVLEQEGDISTMLETIAAKEKEVTIKQMNLQKKEMDLLDLEEKLAAREKAEILRLLDDHHKSLYSKKEEFELELEKKKQAFEEDLKDQMDVLEKKKIELNCREDQILTSELALERKTENLKDKERNADEKERALEGREDFLKIAEKNLKDEKEQLAVDTEKLLTFKDELESLRSTINAEEKQISREKESIISLKAEVEQKLDYCRTMKDILTKETEDLRLEKNKFEKEREAVDERRTTLEAELNQLNDEKERFQDWRCIEEEKLRKANLDMTVNIRQELEELSLKKEMLEKENADFACELESKLQREFDQKLQEMENEFERRDIQKAQDLEELSLKKEMLEKEHAEFACELESNLQKKFDKELQEMENKFERRDLQKAQQLEELSLKNELLEKKHAAFACEIESKLQRKFDDKLREIEKDFERGDIQKAQELEELSLKKEFLEKEHSDFACELESQLQRKFDEKLRGMESEFEKRDIQKVQEIDILQKDLANERENLAKEKENFLAVAEQYKICKNCGFAVTQLDFTELQTPNSTNVAGSQFASSDGRMPLLQRCSMLFDISCGNGARHPIEGQTSKSIPFESEASEGETNYSPDGVQSDNKTKGNMVPERLEKTAKETETTFMAGDTSTDGMVGEPNSSSIDKGDEGGLKTPPMKPSDRHQSGRRGRSKPIKRTYSVEEGVEGAQYTIEAISEYGEQENEGAEPLEHLVDIDEKKQGNLVHGDQMTTGANQQQQFGFVRDDVLEPEKYKVLGNVSVRGHHKKHRTSPTTPSTGEKRYNFRPSTIQKSKPRT